MEYIIDNWYILVGVLCIGAAIGVGIYHFAKMPLSEQMSKVREWLVWACTKAERELGGGTGQLKLRQVYDLFLARFPWLAKVIPFTTFALLVDDALVTVRAMLESNAKVKELVNGTEK